MDKTRPETVKTNLIETTLSTLSFAITVLGFLLLIFLLPSDLKFFKFVIAIFFSLLTIQIFKFLKIWLNLNDQASITNNKVNTALVLLLKNLPSALYIALVVIIFFACIIYLPKIYGILIGIGVGILSDIGYSKLFKVPFFSKKSA